MSHFSSKYHSSSYATVSVDLLSMYRAHDDWDPHQNHGILMFHECTSSNGVPTLEPLELVLGSTCEANVTADEKLKFKIVLIAWNSSNCIALDSKEELLRLDTNRRTGWRAKRTKTVIPSTPFTTSHKFARMNKLIDTTHESFRRDFECRLEREADGTGRVLGRS